MIKVALVGLSPALGAGIRALVSTDEQIKVTIEANAWREFMVHRNDVDVVVTTPTSFESRRNSLDKDSSWPFSILVISDKQIDIDGLNRSVHGWGVLPYESSAEELHAAIHAISEGLVAGTQQLLFSAGVNEEIQSPLTDREEEVLALLAKGMANKQIASALGISEHTVKFHVSSIYTKLNVTNRTEAVREGLRGGWIAL